MIYPLSFVTKRGSSFGYESSNVLKGRVNIGYFCQGKCFSFEECSEDLCIFFLFFTFQIHCSYIVIENLVLIIDIYIYIYIEVVITFFHLSLCVLFLFSFYTHASYLLYAIFYFCFTLRCRDKFCLKCFRYTDCQNLPYHELSSCKVFQEFVLGQILLHSTSEYELSDL